MGASLFAMAALKINDGPAHVLIFYFLNSQYINNFAT